jgi:hypothetical protein
MEDYTPEEIANALKDVYGRLIEEGWLKNDAKEGDSPTSALTKESEAIMLRLKSLFRGRGKEFTDAHYSAFVSIVLHTPERL